MSEAPDVSPYDHDRPERLPGQPALVVTVDAVPTVTAEPPTTQPLAATIAGETRGRDSLTVPSYADNASVDDASSVHDDHKRIAASRSMTMMSRHAELTDPAGSSGALRRWHSEDSPLSGPPTGLVNPALPTPGGMSYTSSSIPRKPRMSTVLDSGFINVTVGRTGADMGTGEVDSFDRDDGEPDDAMEEAELAYLSSYIPDVVMSSIRRDPRPKPRAERLPAAVFYAKIEGFSSITAKQLLRSRSNPVIRGGDSRHLQGDMVAEQLASLFNSFFCILIDAVHKYGGDIIKLAGGSLFVVWAAGDPKGEGESQAHLPETEGATEEQEAKLCTATRLAAQCAMYLLKRVHNYQVLEDVKITLQIGMGAGDVWMRTVGGYQDSWEMFVAGHPLLQMNNALEQSSPGQIVCSWEAWNYLEDYCLGVELQSADRRIEAVRKPVVLGPPRDRVAQALDLVASKRRNVLTLIRGFLPAAVKAPRTEFMPWVTEQARQVTVVIANFPEMDYMMLEELQKVQKFAVTLQECVARYGGYVNQLFANAKGVTMVAGFGLPPAAHEEDAVRAVRTAIDIRSAIRKLGWGRMFGKRSNYFRSAIGIATGRVFCGSVGNATRREYTMVGEVLGTAAGLVALGRDDVLCDRATQIAAQKGIVFEGVSVRMPSSSSSKGKARTVFRPSGAGMGTSTALTERHSVMVGRTREISMFKHYVDQLKETGVGEVVILTAEPGMGKTMLISEVRRIASAMLLRVLSGAGEHVMEHIPFASWRNIFVELLDIQTTAISKSGQQRQHSALAMHPLFRDSPSLRGLLPLLNVVIPDLHIPESDVTKDMTGQARADNTRFLLFNLLRQAASSGPLLILLENARAMDSASWGLVELAARQLRSVLFVLTARPGPSRIQIPSRVEVRHMRLEPLGHDAMEELIANLLSLGVGEIPDKVKDFVYEKSRGNPRFAEELVFALRDSSVIKVTNGRCVIFKQLDVAFGDSLHNLVTSRIDALPTDSLRFLIKAASVVGVTFSLNILLAIHPNPDSAQIQKDLEILEQFDLISPSQQSGEYRFKHDITRIVAYDMMLLAQRRKLHEAIAEWYRTNTDEGMTSMYAKLAHHYGSAEKPDIAVEYVEKAAEHALNNFAYQEAAGYFKRSLMHYNAQEPKNREMISNSEIGLAEAYLRMGAVQDALDHFTRALDQLGFPVPPRGWKMALWYYKSAIASSLGIKRNLSNESRIRRERAAATSLGLYQVSVINSDLVGAQFHSRRALHLARSLPPPNSMLPRGYATHGLVLAMNGKVPQARQCFRRAMSLCEKLDDVTTQAFVKVVKASFLLGQGDWAGAEMIATEASQQSSSIGHQGIHAEALQVLIRVAVSRGDFSTSRSLRTQLIQSAAARGDSQMQSWALADEVGDLLRRGLVHQALKVGYEILDLQRAANMLASTHHTRERKALVDSVIGHGLLAAAHMANHSQDNAINEALSAASVTENSEPLTWLGQEGYVAAAEVLLRRCLVQPEPAAHVVKRAKSALATLGKFAKRFPSAQPSYLICEGINAQWTGGSPLAGKPFFLKSLRTAQDLGMPYQEALAHRLLSEITGQSTHTKEAESILAKLDLGNTDSHESSAASASTINAF